LTGHSIYHDKQRQPTNVLILLEAALICRQSCAHITTAGLCKNFGQGHPQDIFSGEDERVI